MFAPGVVTASWTISEYRLVTARSRPHRSDTARRPQERLCGLRTSGMSPNPTRTFLARQRPYNAPCWRVIRRRYPTPVPPTNRKRCRLAGMFDSYQGSTRLTDLVAGRVAALRAAASLRLATFRRAPRRGSDASAAEPRAAGRRAAGRFGEQQRRQRRGHARGYLIGGRLTLAADPLERLRRHPKLGQDDVVDEQRGAGQPIAEASAAMRSGGGVCEPSS
jgi:hypothetical protein